MTLSARQAASKEMSAWKLKALHFQNYPREKENAYLFIYFYVLFLFLIGKYTKDVVNARPLIKQRLSSTGMGTSPCAGHSAAHAGRYSKGESRSGLVFGGAKQQNG